jgi:hypothetical protein
MRVKDREFPDVEWTSITSARIWHCSFESLAPVQRLENLQTLVIATWPDESFGALKGLNQLRYLIIIHLPKVSSLTPLRFLGRLESLSLQTLPSWDASGKVQEVDSVAPLGHLKALKHLELLGVRPSGDDLSPLFGLRLESARLSKNDDEAVGELFRRTGASGAFNPEPEIP